MRAQTHRMGPGGGDVQSRICQVTSNRLQLRPRHFHLLTTVRSTLFDDDTIRTLYTQTGLLSLFFLMRRREGRNSGICVSDESAHVSYRYLVAKFTDIFLRFKLGGTRISGLQNNCSLLSTKRKSVALRLERQLRPALDKKRIN